MLFLADIGSSAAALIAVFGFELAADAARRTVYTCAVVAVAAAAITASVFVDSVLVAQLARAIHVTAAFAAGPVAPTRAPPGAHFFSCIASSPLEHRVEHTYLAALFALAVAAYAAVFMCSLDYVWGPFNLDYVWGLELKALSPFSFDYVWGLEPKAPSPFNFDYDRPHRMPASAV